MLYHKHTACLSLKSVCQTSSCKADTPVQLVPDAKNMFVTHDSMKPQVRSVLGSFYILNINFLINSHTVHPTTVSPPSTPSSVLPISVPPRIHWGDLGGSHETLWLSLSPGEPCLGDSGGRDFLVSLAL